MQIVCEKFDYFIFAIYVYLMVDLGLNWNAYSDCYSPIQYFLMMTYVVIVVHRLLFIMKIHPQRSYRSRRCLSFVIYYFIHPLFIVVTVLGFKWQIQNNQNTPNCIPQVRVPWLVWWWLVILCIVDILLILITVFKFVYWWKMRQMRLRVHRAFEQNLEGALDNTLEGQLLEQGNEQSARVPLSAVEVANLQEIEFKESLFNIFGQSEECCICFEELRNTQNVIQLPICNHIFHPHCIKKWLVINPGCPMCRDNVRSNIVTQRRNMDLEQQQQLQNA